MGRKREVSEEEGDSDAFVFMCSQALLNVLWREYNAYHTHSHVGNEAFLDPKASGRDLFQIFHLLCIGALVVLY